jgi:hypothetical protein
MAMSAVWSCMMMHEIKAMVQSDFGFDARLKSYRSSNPKSDSTIALISAKTSKQDHTSIYFDPIFLMQY